MITTILLTLSLTQALAPIDSVPKKYKRFLVRQVRFVWGMDEKPSTFAAQIRQESNWNKNANSPYAAGLTQFTPSTAKWISKLYPSLKNESPNQPKKLTDMRYDWKWSIKAMVRYDHLLYSKLTARTLNDKTNWRLTLRAYNGGLGWIYKELAKCKVLNFDCCLRFRARVHCKENISYPAKILTKWKPKYEAWN